MTPDVNIVLLDFRDRPGREMVVENEDGSFTIIINSRLSTQGQRDAYYHARRHIDNDDFEKERDNITSLDLQLQIVLEKTGNGEYKLRPNEAKVVIRSTFENKETKIKMSTIDQYQLYIMGINQVNEIVAPEYVKELMAQGK